jgi:hypothetical protein
MHDSFSSSALHLSEPLAGYLLLIFSSSNSVPGRGSHFGVRLARRINIFSTSLTRSRPRRRNWKKNRKSVPLTILKIFQRLMKWRQCCISSETRCQRTYLTQSCQFSVYFNSLKTTPPYLLQHLDFELSSDSPVEILHVVLLGVVKYWWRDTVSRQTTQGKEELKTILSSIDVAGLNCSCLRGNMDVQYARSLVGHYFRVILQVAPAVLHGLIPETHSQGWVTLCKLAPLMFQPAIENLPVYIVNSASIQNSSLFLTMHQAKLKDAVFDFLVATALWNTQWFNKPKFHLFVHIVEHIRCFGPLILFATETFESSQFGIWLVGDLSGSGRPANHLNCHVKLESKCWHYSRIISF